MGKPCKVAQEKWDAHKEHLRMLYIGKDKPLDDVIQLAASEHGFHATKAQYIRQFKKWSFHKNATSAQWKAISKAVNCRKATGKDSTVQISGQQISRQKLHKELTRYCEAPDAVDDLDSQHMEGVVVGTPNEPQNEPENIEDTELETDFSPIEDTSKILSDLRLSHSMLSFLADAAEKNVFDIRMSFGGFRFDIDQLYQYRDLLQDLTKLISQARELKKRILDLEKVFRTGCPDLERLTLDDGVRRLRVRLVHWEEEQLLQRYLDLLMAVCKARSVPEPKLSEELTTHRETSTAAHRSDEEHMEEIVVAMQRIPQDDPMLIDNTELTATFGVRATTLPTETKPVEHTKPEPKLAAPTNACAVVDALNGNFNTLDWLSNNAQQKGDQNDRPRSENTPPLCANEDLRLHYTNIVSRARHLRLTCVELFRAFQAAYSHRMSLRLRDWGRRLDFWQLFMSIEELHCEYMELRTSMVLESAAGC